jgi:hypothetical protein
MKKYAYMQWFALCLALLAWVGVWFFAQAIAQDESDRAAAVAAAQESSAQTDSSVRMHALTQDTAQERAQLDALLNVDVVSAANMIEAAGTAAGAAVTLGDAVPENAPTSAPGGSAIQAVGFIVDAQGTFPALMRAAELFETLPIPSTLTQLDIQQVPNPAGAGASNQWHMSAYIRVLTTSNISS